MNVSENKKTLVIGASENPVRYSFLAINELRAKGHEVEALGIKAGKVNDVTIHTEKKPIPNLHTVTLYINPAHQKEYYEYILSLNPKRIIFNPGAENSEFLSLAASKGIETKEACTLVMLHTHQF